MNNAAFHTKQLIFRIQHPRMANQQQVMAPVANSLPLMTDKQLRSNDPVSVGGRQNFVPDQTLRKSTGLDHGSVTKPSGLPVLSAPGRGGHMMMKGDRGLSLVSEDTALTKQILATHAGDYDNIDVRPVLAIVQDIMRLAKPLTSDSTAVETQIQPRLDRKDGKIDSKYEDKTYHSSITGDKAYQSTKLGDIAYSSSYHDTDIVKMLAYPISKISSEMICKCAAGAEAHSTTMDFLKLLTNYSWDAKVVITFAAFAINYGEFWLVEQHQTKNLLAKNIAALKDFPETTEAAMELRNKFEAVVNLLNTLLQLTLSIIEFKELPSQFFSHESPEMATATAHIPTAVYWIVRSLLACASLLLNLIGSSHQYLSSTSESWEILNLGHKLTVMMDHLQKQLKICKEIIERKKGEDAYLAFKKLMEGVHMDNMKVLRAMFRSRDDQKPLFNGSQTTNVRLDVLRLKHVLLLISDLDIPHEELNILHLIYNQQARRQEYEVLWLPIVDPTASINSFQETEFHNLKRNMPWHSAEHPSLIEPVAIRYIREVWNFAHRPMLVVLDPQGKPSNLDALPMMWIWGSSGFPFTKITEKSLWAESKWNIELLADSIDPRITDWIRENRVICLYGGEDIEWIRKFTSSARIVAKDLNIPLEMLYVGKRNPKERVRHCHEVIDRERLSHVFSVKDYSDYIWFFWVRLLSMWNSKKQIGMSVEADPMMQEVLDMLTFDSSEYGWAVFSRGNNEMAKGKVEILVPVLDHYKAWANKVDRTERFVEVLDEEIRGVHPEHHCNRLILPGHAGHIPERVVCSECGKTMDKFIMYRCCTD